MMTTYRDAAEKLWGEAGALVHDFYHEHLPHFTNLPDELPIVIGLSAYGRCAGLSRLDDPDLDGPRITIASTEWANGVNHVKDVMLHEMMHVSLWLAGKKPDHQSADWYAECERLAPVVLGHEIELVSFSKQRKSVRVPNPKWSEDNPDDVSKTVVRKVARDDLKYPHADVAHFPQPFRQEGWDWGDVVSVPTY